MPQKFQEFSKIPKIKDAWMAVALYQSLQVSNPNLDQGPT